MLLGCLGCQKKGKGLEKNPFGNAYPRANPPLESDNPQVLAQKMFEIDAKGAAKVGPRVLREWLKSSAVCLIDLTPEEVKSKYSAIEGSKSLLEVEQLKLAKTSVFVLIGSGQQVNKLESVYRELEEKGYSSLFILDGGIEAWHLIYGPR